MSKILISNWKDVNHPNAGGAELVIHELAKRMVADGNNVTFLTSKYHSAKRIETIDGIEIIRIGGNKYLHSFFALIYYLKNLRGKSDLIIECVNTSPYFFKFFKKSEKVVLFYHQLAREIWFYETNAILALLGYIILEPVATFLESLFSQCVITISESTKKDLMKFGFKNENIHIISEGVNVPHLKSIDAEDKMTDEFTILYLGSMRKMKRPIDTVKAFEIATKTIPNLKLVMAGGGNTEEVSKYVQKRNLNNIEILGRISEDEKVKLMRKSHLLISTSLKEGWGLTITEAAVNGTPSVAYDVDGLRDSVKNALTGLITKENTPEELAGIIVILAEDKEMYRTIRGNAYKMNLQYTFEKSYDDLKKIIFTNNPLEKN